MSLHYLVKLEILIGYVLPFCYRKKPQNLFHLNRGPHNICQIWIQLITACRNIARKDVQNTHHWPKWTEKATENGVGQVGSCRHCGSHSSVASLIAPDQWCVFYTPSFAIFPTCCYQIWWIWRPQLRWDKFSSFFPHVTNNSTLALAQWAFKVSQGSVETLFTWGGKRLIILQQIYSGNDVPDFIKIAWVL